MKKKWVMGGGLHSLYDGSGTHLQGNGPLHKKDEKGGGRIQNRSLIGGIPVFFAWKKQTELEKEGVTFGQERKGPPAHQGPGEGCLG